MRAPGFVDHQRAVADALCARFGAARIDVTDVILDAMRERAAAVGLDWNMILDADAATDREGLRGFVAQAVPAVVEAVAAVGSQVVLTDFSTLAAYGQLGIVSNWTDLKEAVNLALQEFIARRAQARLVESFGTLDWDDSYDYKDDRRSRDRKLAADP